MSAWAAQPLAKEKVALIHQAWNVLYAGWSYASVNQTREAMLKLFPDKVKRKEYRTTCSDQWGGAEFGMPVYENPCDPALGGVTSYANLLSNERHPPYTWSEPIAWQP